MEKFRTGPAVLQAESLSQSQNQCPYHLWRTKRHGMELTRLASKPRGSSAGAVLEDLTALRNPDTLAQVSQALCST